MPIYAVLSTLFACAEQAENNLPIANQDPPATSQKQPEFPPLTEEDKKIIQALGVGVTSTDTFLPNNRIPNWAKPLARGDTLDHADFEAVSKNPSPIAASVRQMFDDFRDFHKDDGSSRAYVLFSTRDAILKKNNRSIPATSEHGIIAGTFQKPLLTLFQMGLHALYPKSDFQYGAYDNQTSKIVQQFENDNNISPVNGNDVDRTTLSMLLINMDTPKEKLIADLKKMRAEMLEGKSTPFLLDKSYAESARSVIRALQYSHPNEMAPYKGIVNNDVGRQLCEQANKVYGSSFGLPTGTTISVGPDVLGKLIEQLGGAVTPKKSGTSSILTVAEVIPE